MRLTPVDTATSIPTKLRCCVCGQWCNSGDLVADLDGTPFQAYYCLGTIIDGRPLSKGCANHFIESGAHVIQR